MYHVPYTTYTAEHRLLPAEDSILCDMHGGTLPQLVGQTHRLQLRLLWNVRGKTFTDKPDSHMRPKPRTSFWSSSTDHPGFCLLRILPANGFVANGVQARSALAYNGLSSHYCNP